MIKIGLTGGIASGKSTISNIIRNDLNIPIIDCDIIARDVLNIYPEILLKISSEFGSKYINDKGELLRKDFGNFIFKNPIEKKKYEDIIMSYIKKEIFNEIHKNEIDNVKLCIIDAPTLIETKLYKEMDQNMLVCVNDDIQIHRVMERDNFTEKEAVDRINSQMLIKDKMKYANYIINNNNSIEYTKKQVIKIIKTIKYCYNIK